MPTLAHRIALDPTPAQVAAFEQYAGCARFVYNFALGCWRDWWAEYRRAERDGRAHEMEKPSWAVLGTTFSAVRKDLFPWMEGSAFSACWWRPFAELQEAYRSWFAGHAGPARFKSKRRSRSSFYISNQRLKLDGRRAYIPKLGWVRMWEPLRFHGKVMGSRVWQDVDGRWYLSVQVDLGDAYRRSQVDRPADVVGVDLGISTLATLSTGEKVAGPRALEQAQAKLRRVQRKLARQKKGSNRRAQTVARLGRMHVRIRNLRNDALHKLTSKLCRENQAVVIEDLAVQGLCRSKLARQVADQGFGEFRRQLTYKAPLHGVELIVADRWYPSTKTCSGCGAVQDVPLPQRTYTCKPCGLVLNRDVNAAINLEMYGRRARNTKPVDTGGHLLARAGVPVEEAGSRQLSC